MVFPQKVYDGKLDRFDVTFTEVSGEVGGWTDNMEDSKGSVDGSLILIDEIGERGDGNVLRIRPEADRAYYTWPTVVATETTEFSYRVRSHNARNMCVEVQLFDQSTGWSTISKPTVSDSGVLDWVTETVPLKGYAGKGVSVRVMVTSEGSHFSDVNDKAVGVQLDDIAFTNVRKPLDSAIRRMATTSMRRPSTLPTRRPAPAATTRSSSGRLRSARRTTATSAASVSRTSMPTTV